MGQGTLNFTPNRARKQIRESRTPVGDDLLIRIDRRPNLNTPEREPWNDYTNQLGQLNWRYNLYPLGKMACTYVSSNELLGMLSDKYPRAYQDYRSAIKLHRRFAQNFSNFVKQSLRGKVEVERLTTFSERHVQEDDTPFYEEDSFDLDDQWRRAEFRLKPTLKPLGGTVCLDLSANDSLYEEYDAVLDYLYKDEKLNLRFLSHPDFKPHIKLLDSRFGIVNLDNVRLPDEPYPHTLELEAPAVWYDPVKW